MIKLPCLHLTEVYDLTNVLVAEWETPDLKGHFIIKKCEIIII